MDSPHTSCTEHSGMNVRLTINIAFSGFAIFLLGVAINLLIGISSQLVVANSERSSLQGQMVAVKSTISDIDDRVQRLESYYQR